MNNLGITKAEGRAALERLQYLDRTAFPEDYVFYVFETHPLRGAFDLIGIVGHSLLRRHYETALAWIASLSGVVDAKGEPK